MTDDSRDAAREYEPPWRYGAVCSPSSSATLDEVVERLATHPNVAGAALGGSGQESALAAVSDLDLLIVVDEAWGDLRVGVTWIDGRMGDLLFATPREIEAIASAKPPLCADPWVRRLALFLSSARILLDPSGALAKAQTAALHRSDAATEPTRGAAYSAWNKINYDRQHNRRMLASDDPVYATALDVRLLYGLADVFAGYFAIRGLRWEGEKTAVRHLREHDPDFLRLFRRCLAEQDRSAKLTLYERLCQEATAPAGGLWPDEPTSAHLRDRDAATPEAHAAATAFVQSLVRAD